MKKLITLVLLVVFVGVVNAKPVLPAVMWNCHGECKENVRR